MVRSFDIIILCSVHKQQMIPKVIGGVAFCYLVITLLVERSVSDTQIHGARMAFRARCRADDDTAFQQYAICVGRVTGPWSEMYEVLEN